MVMQILIKKFLKFKTKREVREKVRSDRYSFVNYEILCNNNNNNGKIQTVH